MKASHAVLYFTDIYPRPKAATTVNLSLGGARIETPYGLNPGERLEIAIAIHPQAIKCRAKVVHIQSPNVEGLNAGVRFEELSEDDRLYLTQYLLNLMEQQVRVPHRNELLSEGKYESLEAGSILPFWVLLLLFAFAHSKDGFSRGPRN